jgi:uncharacterized damage-inducible protein DinB
MDSDSGNLKRHLWRYLQAERDSLMRKVDGLSERELRLPRTPTGTNLIGIVKHALNVEFGYFGPTFGRMIENPRGLLEPSDYDEDPQVDWYATAEESSAGILELYRRVQAFADETIDQRDLTSPGKVAWWDPSSSDVTLGQIMLHVTCDLARHAGHADILRESVDGAVGWRGDGDNVPEGYDWAAYTAKLTDLANRF